MSKLSNEYFEWIYGLVCNDRYQENLSYRKLLHFLHDVEFYYIIDRDSNRAHDGISLRYRFAYDNVYSKGVIDEYLMDQPCSVLEMMVALSLKIEEYIMDDPHYGNRTGQWFWNMLVNLGLSGMSDSKFDLYYAESVISKFLNREYKRNGEGGLFTIEQQELDMRDAEIWYQAMWYLDENIDFSI